MCRGQASVGARVAFVPKCRGGVLYAPSKLVGLAAFCCIGCVLEAHAQPLPVGDSQPVPQGTAQQQPSTPPPSASPRFNRLPTVMVQTTHVRRIRRATKPSLPTAPPPTPAAATIASTPPPPGISTGGTEGTATNGYKATTAANIGPFSNVSLQNTPYSVSITPGALWENNNSHTVSDALKTNPTVVPLIDSTAPASGLSRIMIRGFTAADQDELRDGITDRSYTYPPLENVDHIEVFNGPTGFLYGFTEPGGMINYVSKQPTATAFATLSSGVYGGGIVYGHADAGGPIDPEGRASYRFNLYKEDGNTYIDEGTQQRLLVSGLLNYRINDSSTIAFDYYHQNYQVTGTQVAFGPYVVNGISYVPAAFNPTKQYGQPWTFNSSEKDLIGAKFTTNYDDIFTFRTAVRYGNMQRDYTWISATLTSATGNYTETSTQDTTQNEQTWGGYALVDAKFDTGPAHHVVTFGYTDTYFYFTRGPDVNTKLGTSNVNTPAQFSEPDTVIPGTSNFQAQNIGNALIGDHITFNRYWAALIGVNDAMVHQTGGGISSVLSTADYNASKVSPTYALLFTPQSWVTLYASYLEGLEAGDQAPSTANGIPVVNANAILPPSVSTSYEAGAKMDFGRFFLTTALFDINKVNAEVNPSSNVYIQDGREDHRGVEVIGKGKITDQLTFVGGFTLLDAKIEQATALPASNGKIPINVPEQEARAYFEYALPETFVPGLTFVAGANYYGKRPVDALNTGFLAPATTVDVGLRYEPVVWGRKLAFNLTVSNVFNVSYWSSYGGGGATGMLLGTPRLFAFSGKIPLG
jgi:iron complex outermembrane recepter protein